MGSTSNKIKTDLLGMPIGTATGRLRKSLLFSFAKELNKDTCYRCGSKIEQIDDFSIEHKQSWQFSDDPIRAFFDLANIAFSHIVCNVKAGEKKLTVRVSNRRGQIISCPEGTSWCFRCRSFKSLDSFTLDSRRYNKKHKECQECRKSFRTPELPT